jgi:hypothetical protein
MRCFVTGIFPAGALLGGVLAEAAGVRAALWTAAVIILLSPLPTWRALHGLRDIEQTQL